ncbi:RNA 2'-phosphotransferase [Streptomyces sp. GS7]|uniref:RNA 2'-phosphotransferase n=1 Tax=Streptomyces sp. GS7 TaxID=2692234 RepID=UPI001317DFAE|nr:RNA 2'-phosphotransferase [Streptomyces sp. GS7]QHC26502.1 RNA 2'-phosphotransferase [Streptomyces sp. GS7]
MNHQRSVRISKYLAKHLRHEPERIGIALDARGWVPVTELVEAAARHGFPFSRAELEAVVAGSDKQRYALEDGRIRANQGHSVPIDLGLPPAVPPDHLFHGTVARSVAAIREQGLRPMSRHAVHLSPDRETATRVGARRGKAVVLTVDATAMHRRGHVFRVSANGVWLTDRVPPEFLRFPG